MQPANSLEDYFSPFRQNIIGNELSFETPFGRKRILYADWTASGRAYGPIEAELQDEILPYFANTHTEATFTGRMMSGLRLPERVRDYVKCLQIDESLRPLVLVTHMEHHSNHISWLETIATVEIIRPGKDGNVDLEHLRELLQRFSHRKNKIAAVTAC
jgi:selenocysteine lyase/cysteine desulfurase